MSDDLTRAILGAAAAIAVATVTWASKQMREVSRMKDTLSSVQQQIGQLANRLETVKTNDLHHLDERTKNIAEDLAEIKGILRERERTRRLEGLS